MKYIIAIIISIIPSVISSNNDEFCWASDEDNTEYSIENSIPNVKVTVYHAVAAQCNSDWTRTADMTYLGTDPNDMLRHRIVAVSRDLLTEWGLSMGDTITLRGLSVEEYNGKWIVHDKMNKRFTKKIDLLVNLDSPWLSSKEKTYIWK